MAMSACTSKTEKKEKISPRDYSVTKENSYNDLFLDSVAVREYIEKNQITDTVGLRMVSFYNKRNYQYAWFSSDGLSEEAKGFSSLLNVSTDTAENFKKLKGKLRDLQTGSVKITESNKNIREMELSLTENLIRFSINTIDPKLIVRKEIERFIPIKKMDAMVLADSIISMQSKKKKDFADINGPYNDLLSHLKDYVKIEKEKKWQSLPENEKTFKKTLTPTQILVLKNNLNLLGYMPVKDSTPVVSAELLKAIQQYQVASGFKPDGKMDQLIWEMLNTTPKQRIKQIILNMDRMRWTPLNISGDLIVVNIPEFIFRMYDKQKEVFSMPVVVGKESNNTTIFSDFLQTIVFSPYWNVPPSIVKKEILPGMEKNPDYLASHNMEINGETGGLPDVRQLPGPSNSLGKVKFLFPNSFNIYFHDTPAKSLFQEEVRTFSHGCIRLGDPYKLAEYLLRNDPKWTPEKIKAAMNSGKETFVKLDQPVPVYITYYTAWVDGNGRLNFRKDIYDHDKEIIAKMFL